MPVSLIETGENTSNPSAEYLVYIDRTTSSSVVEKMAPVAGFDKLIPIGAFNARNMMRIEDDRPENALTCRPML
jgi:hypothetical protein